MRTNIQNLVDTQLTDADIVTAIDPEHPDYSQQLFGQDSVPPLRAPNAPARMVNVLEIEINSKNVEQLDHLLTRIETVKGHLPQDVLRLRKPK